VSSLCWKTVFASIVAPLNRVQCLPRVVFWTWLHLLQFCVSNQCINPEEDAVNKPWRPIPTGRVTVSQAQNLRWVLVAACLAFSLYRGVLPASILLCLFTIAYNDLGFHSHVVMRNVCNALGYASFELGATQLAGMFSSYMHDFMLSEEAKQATPPFVRLASCH
jgi:4-hydroxybenzoate polyprenyltransferase